MDPREYPRDVQIISRAPRLTKKRQCDLEYETMRQQIENLFQQLAVLECKDLERTRAEDEMACPFVDGELCLGPAIVETQTVCPAGDYNPFNVSEDSFGDFFSEENYVDLIGDPIFDTYGDDEKRYVHVVDNSFVGQQELNCEEKKYFFSQFEEVKVLRQASTVDGDVTALPKFWSDVFERLFVAPIDTSSSAIFYRKYMQLCATRVKSRYHGFGVQLLKVLNWRIWPFDPGGGPLPIHKTRGRVFFKRGRMMYIGCFTDIVRVRVGYSVQIKRRQLISNGNGDPKRTSSKLLIIPYFGHPKSSWASFSRISVS